MYKNMNFMILKIILIVLLILLVIQQILKPRIEKKTPIYNKPSRTTHQIYNF